MPLGPGQQVRHRDNPARLGTLTNRAPRQRAMGVQHEVQWPERNDWHYESELEVVAPNQPDDDVYTLIDDARYGRADDLRRLLTHLHLSGRLANVVYSMGLTETDFYAHQYKPLLTLLDSPTNGLLIADEVGLGKTIEAGLIWTELRARYDMRRLLVVCPAALREKWKDELERRFGIDARVVGATELLSDLSQRANARREQAWIVSYPAVRVPTQWDPDQVADPSEPRVRKSAYQLANLFCDFGRRAEQLFDLVVFDEAHTMRNAETGAHRLGELLRQVTTHQVMLSATPISMRATDLFRLLHLLDPDHFVNEREFEDLRQANVPLIAASAVVQNPRKTKDEIVQAVADLVRTSLLPPARLERLVDEARQIEEWTIGRRIEFGAKIERLNLLAHVVCRTRKRDVQINRVERRVQRIGSTMTDDERLLYNTVTEGTRDYALSRGISDGFLVCMPQRMVASCAAALIRTWNAHEPNDDDAISTVLDESSDDVESLLDADHSLREFLVTRVRRAFQGRGLGTLESADTKFDKLVGTLNQHLGQNPSEKAIVFTTFRGTARYLQERLTQRNLPSVLLMGGADFDKQAIVEAFRRDPQLRVLVCTEVMAEGVDLQFSSLLANYDLPWNPTRIEQRIGRIDRIGQKAAVIQILNFFHEDTIDARIVERLSQRIDVFESTMGAAEEVLGEVRALENVLLTQRLTPAEEARRIEQSAMALERIARDQEALERDAVQLVAHGQELIERIELARGEGKAVGKSDLIRLAESYLISRAGCRFLQARSDPDSFEIQLSAAEATELEQYIRREGLAGRTGLVSGQVRACRFADRITERPRVGEEIIHRFHPFVRFVTRGPDDSTHYPLFACQLHDSGIQSGTYAVTVWTTEFGGVKAEE
ncbi:MAG: DEAD/DEAH box helicase, partial [Deltaproteobacteria bacterium]|nr:DEAD/DEAH box helicase [Deltaproteobacteria bacterium]